MSFGLITRAVGRQLWSLEDRQAVTDYIVSNIANGETLDPEFLYLPLLLAGTYISNKVVLEDEDPRHSLALMRKAYEARADLFLDDEMAVASQAYHQIWKKAMA
jgi:phage FluMu gp28-like protein